MRLGGFGYNGAVGDNISWGYDIRDNLNDERSVSEK